MSSVQSTSCDAPSASSLSRALGDIRKVDVQDAVVRNLEVVGEAAKQVPDSLRERAPELPTTRERIVALIEELEAEGDQEA
jgi:hypothetical protein